MDASRGSGGAIFPMPQQIPALLDPPPPPRPLPSSLSLSSSPSRHAPSIANFPILLLTVLGILTTSVLLLAYYVFVIRCCLNWHSSSSGAAARRRQRASTTTSSSLPVSGGAPAEPRGLEEAAIQVLPAFRYSRKKAVTNAAAAPGPGPASECAVCLGEFEDEERVRMLPACLHLFHVACIDTWLHANANCPLCRADIATHCMLPLPLPLPLPPLQESDQLRRPQEQEVVIQLVPGAEEADDTAQARAQQRGAATAPAEPAGEGEATDRQVVVVGEKRKSVSAWHEIDISSNKGDECVAEREDGDVVVLPPLRRSFSMGTMGDEEVHLQIQKFWQMNTRSHSDDHDSDSSSSSSV